MARQRPIQTGHVFSKGPSWFCQWREDVRNEAGEIERRKFTARLCATKTAEKEVTQREAERLAWDTVLGRLNAVSIFPETLATVREFWESRFIPEHGMTLKAAGRKHYSWLAGLVLPALGHLTLRQVTAAHVQKLIHEQHAAGQSPQTCKHIRNAVSAMFRHATVAGFFHGANPAQGVSTPRLVRKEAPALRFDQAAALIDALPEPLATMAHLATVTGLGMAELLGLSWCDVNLASEAVQTQGGLIPAAALIVRRNFYAGEFSTPKTAARARVIPLTPSLLARLSTHQARQLASKTPNPADLVFCGRTGRPLCQNNLRNRYLAPTAKRILGRVVTFHQFRHAAATFSDWVDMPLRERIAMMGHARAAMTFYYTGQDLDRRRPYLAEIERRLAAPAAPAAPAEPAEPAAPAAKLTLEDFVIETGTIH